jgi:hypothetical protein
MTGPLSTNLYNDQYKTAMKGAVLYMFWIVVHQGATYIYANYCVPTTFYGFFTTPFMSNMPHCVASRWVINNGAKVIDNMWTVVGLLLISSIFIMPKFAA